MNNSGWSNPPGTPAEPAFTPGPKVVMPASPIALLAELRAKEPPRPVEDSQALENVIAAPPIMDLDDPMLRAAIDTFKAMFSMSAPRLAVQGAENSRVVLRTKESTPDGSPLAAVVLGAGPAYTLHALFYAGWLSPGDIIARNFIQRRLMNRSIAGPLFDDVKLVCAGVPQDLAARLVQVVTNMVLRHTQPAAARGEFWNEMLYGAMSIAVNSTVESEDTPPDAQKAASELVGLVNAIWQGGAFTAPGNVANATPARNGMLAELVRSVCENISQRTAQTAT